MGGSFFGDTRFALGLGVGGATIVEEAGLNLALPGAKVGDDGATGATTRTHGGGFDFAGFAVVQNGFVFPYDVVVGGVVSGDDFATANEVVGGAGKGIGVGDGGDEGGFARE